MTRDIRNNVDDHPANEHKFTFDDEYNDLQSILERWIGAWTGGEAMAVG